MVVVKGLQTTVGEYGILRRGKTIQVKASVAKHLEKEGLAEIVTEDDGEDTTPGIRGGVRITDVSGNIQATDDNKVIKKDVVIKPEDPAKEPDEPAKAEDTKPEQAEEPKKEVKETPKKKFQ